MTSSPSKLMQTANLAKLLAIPEISDHADKIERRLKAAVSSPTPSIKVPALRYLRAYGKPTFHFQVISAAKCQGGRVDDSTITICVTNELAQLGIHILDDVLHNNKLRWGAATINAQESVNQAIGIGYFYLAAAIQEALSLGSDMAKVIITGIIQDNIGRRMENCERYNTSKTVDTNWSILEHKSSALVSAAFRMGGLSAGLANEQAEALANYGKYFEISRQLIDDLASLTTDESTGESLGREAGQGFYTLPLILGLQGPEKNRIKSLLQNLPSGMDAPPELLKLLKSSGAIDQTIKEIRRNNDLCVQSLSALDDTKVVSGLSQLPSLYLSAELEFNAAKLQ